MNESRDEKTNILTNTSKIQEATKTYLKTFYYTKLQTPREMDGLFGAYGLPKLNQDEINSVGWPITSNELESVIKNLTKSSPGLDGCGVEFYHTFKEDIILISFKLFHKIKRKVHFQKRKIMDWSLPDEPRGKSPQ